MPFECISVNIAHGDVYGPNSVEDGDIAVFSGPSGKILSASGWRILSTPPASFDAPGNEGDLYLGTQAVVYYKGGGWRFLPVNSGSGSFPFAP